MTKDEFIKHLKEINPPDMYIKEDKRYDYYFVTNDNWSMANFNDKTFCFFRFYFANEIGPQLTTCFIGEYEDWDFETIEKLSNDFWESRKQAELDFKKYKMKKELNEIKGDFND